MSSKHGTTSAAASPFIGADGVFKNNQQQTVTTPTAFGSMGSMLGTGRGAFGSQSRVRGSEVGTATPTAPTQMKLASTVTSATDDNHDLPVCSLPFPFAWSLLTIL